MSRKLECVECSRPIIAFKNFYKKGRAVRVPVSPSEDHDLCQQCWRAEKDRHRTPSVNPNGEGTAF